MRNGLALLFVPVTVLTACESVPWQKKSADPSGPVDAPPVVEPGLRLSPQQRFADVPLPEGAQEDLERTYVFESKDLQIGRMVYMVKAKVAELGQFYIRECPASDWKLESVLQAEGAELVFAKPGKRLHVSIRPQGVTRGGGSLLVLNLTPDPTTAGVN